MESHGHRIAARLPPRPRRRPLDLLVGLVSLGLVLLGVGVGLLGLDVLLPRPADDPLLAPFRWGPAAANLG